MSSENSIFIVGQGVESEETRSAKGEALKKAMGDADPMVKSFFAYKEWKKKMSLLNRPHRIILVRHGESIANVDPTVYLHTPDNKIPLSKRGEEMALEEGRALRKIVGDESVRFFVSPFTRSRMTCKGIIEGGGFTSYSIAEDPRIREQEWGNYQTEETFTKQVSERREVGAFYYRFPNGESGADVYDRVSAFLDTLFRKFKYKKCSDNFVIVSHGITIRLFLMRYFRWTVETFQDIWNPENCEHFILEREPDSFNFDLKTPLRSNLNLYRRHIGMSTNSEIVLGCGGDGDGIIISSSSGDSDCESDDDRKEIHVIS